MLTLKEFIKKYLGKKVEFHSYGSNAYNQCVDLVNAYINEVLDNNTKDYTEIIGANAKDFESKFDPEDFDWIVNTQTPNVFAERGDIMVWNGNVGGGAGHVSIFLEGDGDNFTSLDQNWSQVEKVTIEKHTYVNVSGWLRPKAYAEIESEESDSGLTFDQTKKLSDELWELFNFNKATGLPRKTSVDSVHKEYNKLVKQIENAPDCADQIQAAVNTSSEALKDTHKDNLKKITTKYLKEIEDLKKTHLAEIKTLETYTSTPNKEGLKEIGRWVLFGITSFLLTYAIDAFVPGLGLDPDLKLKIMAGLIAFQRYVDKYIHENYVKVKGENAIATAINLVKGKAIEEIRKLPISGLAPF